ncbi:MAG: M4 family metallopeptidase [Flavobacteriaceae bacterium]
MGHAYTQYTSGLIYSHQAGAINEAYSDIWGETVDLINGYQDTGENLALRTGCGSSLRWRMGEDASAFGSPIRDMWNPPCNGDPGKVTDGFITVVMGIVAVFILIQEFLIMLMLCW